MSQLNWQYVADRQDWQMTSWSTSPNMTAVFHDRTYCGLIQVEHNSWGKILPRTIYKEPTRCEALLAILQMYLSQERLDVKSRPKQAAGCQRAPAVVFRISHGVAANSLHFILFIMQISFTYWKTIQWSNDCEDSLFNAWMHPAKLALLGQTKGLLRDYCLLCRED